MKKRYENRIKKNKDNRPIFKNVLYREKTIFYLKKAVAIYEKLVFCVFIFR